MRRTVRPVDERSSQACNLRRSVADWLIAHPTTLLRVAGKTAEYQIEPPSFTYGAEIASGFMYPAQPFVEAKVYAGYKRVEPFAGIRIDPLQTAPFVGVRVRFGR